MMENKFLFAIFACFMCLTWGATSHGMGTKPLSPLCLLDLSLGPIESNPEWQRKLVKNAVKNILNNSTPLRDENDPNSGYYKGQFLASGRVDAKTTDDQYWGDTWLRDGGITANALVDVLLDEEFLSDDIFENPDITPKARKQIVLQILMDHLAYVKSVQGMDSVENNLGKAGVYVDPQTGNKMYHPAYGLAKRRKDFSEPGWMNPQIDGMPYEGKGILRLADFFWDQWNKLFNSMSSVRTDLARSDVYRPNKDGDVDQNNSIIKTILEYALHNWWVPTFEMWEEEKSAASDPNGGHFATLMAIQAILLVEGPEFAARVGDHGAPRAYQDGGVEIEKKLSQFWDPKYRIIRTTLDNVIESNPNKNNAPKWNPSDKRIFNGVSAAAPIDGQVVIGLCHGKSPRFTVASDEALSFVYEAEMLFKGFFEINHDKNFVLWGRYINDIYSGTHDSNGKSIRKAQPWTFVTQYVAEHAYKVAEDLSSYGQLRHLFADALKSGSSVQLDGGLMKLLYKQALKENPGVALSKFTELDPSWIHDGLTIKNTDPFFRYLLSLIKNNRFVVTDLNINYYNYVLNQAGYKDILKVGQTIGTEDPLLARVISSQILRGDIISKGLAEYVDEDGNYSEQIDPANDGLRGVAKQRSARKLTWTSGSVIRSIKARKHALARATLYNSTVFSHLTHFRIP